VLFILCRFGLLLVRWLRWRLFVIRLVVFDFLLLLQVLLLLLVLLLYVFQLLLVLLL